VMCVREDKIIQKKCGYSTVLVSVLPHTGHSWGSPLDKVELSGNPATSAKKTCLHTMHANSDFSLTLKHSFLDEFTRQGDMTRW
jgi:hypothetical protein